MSNEMGSGTRLTAAIMLSLLLGSVLVLFSLILIMDTNIGDRRTWMEAFNIACCVGASIGSHTMLVIGLPTDRTLVQSEDVSPDLIPPISIRNNKPKPCGDLALCNSPHQTYLSSGGQAHARIRTKRRGYRRD